MKKILTLLMFLTFAVSVTSFGADVPGGITDELKNYEIMVGDPDGNMRYDDFLTRSEAVKIICTLMMAEPGSYEGVVFPDVLDSHWAKGYIGLAASMGIVEGDDKGNFNPYANVTNEEFLKMLVSALGYTPMAEVRGGFPAGFITIASQTGITENMVLEVNAPATRGDVANFVYRSLDVPFMEQTSFGDSIEYSVLDGNNGKDHKTFRIRLENFEPVIYGEAAESVPDFSGEEYVGILIKIADLAGSDGNYSYRNASQGDASPLYVINNDTYIYMTDNTVSLSEIKSGMYVQCWCYADDKDVIEVLKAEIIKDGAAHFE